MLGLTPPHPIVCTSPACIYNLQGVWNAADGFLLTDPAIHTASKGGRRHVRGGTDKGDSGIANFFRTHRCSALCAQLGLKKFVPAGLG